MNGNERAILTSGTTDRSMPEEVEFAGAGPAGLTLACMLSGYGIRTSVLDGAAGPAPHSRAAVVHARTLEPLGVVGEKLGGGVMVPHFGVRDRLLLDVDFGGWPTAHPYTLIPIAGRTDRLPRRSVRGGSRERAAQPAGRSPTRQRPRTRRSRVHAGDVSVWPRCDDCSLTNAQ